MKRTSFNTDWLVSGIAGSTESTAVTLPHDAMLYEKRDPATANGYHTGFYPGGVYRYSKTFTAPQAWRRQHVVIEFEGVYMRSEVYLNGVLIGGRPSGYAEFQVILDDQLKYGEENLLEVVANNPSGPNSRWYSGSGIYRPVNLLVGPRLHIDSSGVQLRTVGLEGTKATIHARATITNEDIKAQRSKLTLTLRGPDRDEFSATSQEVVTQPGTSAVHDLEFVLDGAHLWSPEHPHLYKVLAELASNSGLDTAEDTFGIRLITVDAHQGLQINGATIKLRGGCIHHDNGIIGAHTLEAAEERRIRILRDAGYNAIRSAHNAVSRATLRACDKLGMLVMDELGDEWWRPKSRDGFSRHFLEWWQRDLDALIAKDYNHPSVIMYSIGNEIGEISTDQGKALGYDMAAHARATDPGRLTTNGVNVFLSFIAPKEDTKVESQTVETKEKADDPEKTIATLNFLMGAFEKLTPLLLRLPQAESRTRDAQFALDVAGYNYGHDRWVRDTKRYPNRVIVGTETTPSTTATLWSLINAMPNVIGEFVWTAWDYVGEAGIATQQYDSPRKLFQPYPALLAGAPIIDITGYRQPWSYYNEIVWGLSKGPSLAVHPLNHAGQKRTKNNWRPTDAVRSWSWSGYEGVKAEVDVYADAHRVDLHLNDKLIATRKIKAKDQFRCTFSMPYTPGKLTATAYDKSGNIVGSDTLASAGPETLLRATAETDEAKADGADLVYVNVELTDNNGVLKPLADRPVTVSVEGEGTLLGFGSANPATPEELSSPIHSTYQGRAQAVIRTTTRPGGITLTVNAEGMAQTTIKITTTPTPRKPAPRLGRMLQARYLP
ncbi:glycoside hydrolase family 2 TIM barrel-domain containing protein [Arthrobacter sp. 135MFCol5.1]|uniref:glycoside hydrolase family 2 TIM barrel-domain containing protein n=1 Tax=Arthrobacter sp. 135MFCol5.1 TaxID=1158050 RepID=UPI00039F8051|nr:glycoside hydrolase family 2 TIM barrel-domain containing protein [Arthrobacter sp. 135MFCol5.1]